MLLLHVTMAQVEQFVVLDSDNTHRNGKLIGTALSLRVLCAPTFSLSLTIIQSELHYKITQVPPPQFFNQGEDIPELFHIFYPSTYSE